MEVSDFYEWALYDIVVGGKIVMSFKLFQIW